MLQLSQLRLGTAGAICSCSQQEQVPMSKFEGNVNYGLLLQNPETGKLQQVPMEHTALLGSSHCLLCSLGVSAPTWVPCIPVPSPHCWKTPNPLLRADHNSILCCILSSTMDLRTILIHLSGALIPASDSVEPPCSHECERS